MNRRNSYADSLQTKPRDSVQKKTQKESAEYNDILEKLRKEFYQRFDKKTISTADGLKEFQRTTILGEGSFGRVVLAKHQDTGALYAIKCLEKVKLIKLKQIEHTLYEKKMLEAIRFPFIISMDYCYKDNSYIYFVMPYLNGGDMFIHLRKLRKFDENLSRFYASQVLLGIEYLHFCDIIYRDLKPENLLLDLKGYIKIADLGFCKVVKGRTWTLCGTPEYIAPEIILSKGYAKAVDWWSFGVLLFEMSAGYSPFTSRDPMSIYEKIVSGKFKTPAHFSLQLMDIVKNLLQVDLTRRFGNLKSGVADIKEHKWFHNISFIDVFYRRMEAPYTPTVKSPEDTSNFDKFSGKVDFKVSSVEQFRSEFDQF